MVNNWFNTACSLVDLSLCLSVFVRAEQGATPRPHPSCVLLLRQVTGAEEDKIQIMMPRVLLTAPPISSLKHMHTHNDTQPSFAAGLQFGVAEMSTTCMYAA